MKILTDQDYKRQLMVIEELANQVNRLKELCLKVVSERDNLKDRLKIY